MVFIRIVSRCRNGWERWIEKGFRYDLFLIQIISIRVCFCNLSMNSQMFLDMLSEFFYIEDT